MCSLSELWPCSATLFLSSGPLASDAPCKPSGLLILFFPFPAFFFRFLPVLGLGVGVPSASPS